eukprot:TRINITY_DN66899_c0_g1_i1.p1 TRINITY_DN66899_c0_g1~~TRINITY_DN66899_c0_g1_i1.p1  ORF type:complete len:357 (-),score=45.97 TRINITY_DN66899_c0_g1_i1:299-1369(-)
MRREKCAMTTRVSPSFLRVGQFELFGRRARRRDPTGLKELEQLVKHSLWRDYSQHASENATLQRQVLDMLKDAQQRFASLAAAWIRVGYVQSNFNADNCLVNGRTMDYGPFGFIETYDPEWGMWVGSGSHFAFMNQHNAAGKNFRMLCRSLAPLLDKEGQKELIGLVEEYDEVADHALSQMWARKLGFANATRLTQELAGSLLSLMEQHPTDYTILWRQLAELTTFVSKDARVAEQPSDVLLEPLRPAFEQELSVAKIEAWRQWLVRWLEALLLDAEERSPGDIAALMRRTSPKYIPRERLLKEAYTAAENGDHGPLHVLMELFKRPYDEQPEYEDRFYRRRGQGDHQQGGVGFMS